jgi:hypothetical protein
MNFVQTSVVNAYIACGAGGGGGGRGEVERLDENLPHFLHFSSDLVVKFST